MKRLCDIIGLSSSPEETIEKMAIPLYINGEEGAKGIRSKISKLIIKSSPIYWGKGKKIAFTDQINEMVEI